MSLLMFSRKQNRGVVVVEAINVLMTLGVLVGLVIYYVGWNRHFLE